MILYFRFKFQSDDEISDEPVYLALRGSTEDFSICTSLANSNWDLVVYERTTGADAERAGYDGDTCRDVHVLIDRGFIG